MHEPLHTDPPRTDAHKVVWAIGALLVAIMAAFQVYDVLRRRAIVIDTTERTYASLARSLADQTQLAVLAADLALRETVSDAFLVPPRSFASRELLRKRVSTVPQVQGLLLLGA